MNKLLTTMTLAAALVVSPLTSHAAHGEGQKENARNTTGSEFYGTKDAYIVLKVNEPSAIMVDGIFLGAISPEKARKMVIRPGRHYISAVGQVSKVKLQKKVIIMEETEQVLAFDMIDQKVESGQSATMDDTFLFHNTYTKFSPAQFVTEAAGQKVTYQFGDHSMLVQHEDTSTLRGIPSFNIDLTQKFKVEMVMEWKDGNVNKPYGLAFAADNDLCMNNTHLLAVNAAGEAGYAIITNGNIQWREDMQFSENVSRYKNVNTLVVEGDGAYIYLKVNGTPVGRYVVSTFYGQRFGYYVGGDMDIKVHYMSVTGVQSGVNPNATVMNVKN